MMKKLMSNEEREDALLMLKTFGPMTWECLAIFYNNTFSKARGRRFTADELQDALLKKKPAVA